MVAAYEPYVDVCRRLGELSPCRGSDQKSILLNSGAEAVENAVKIARAATGRPAIVTFDRGFHGRTLMTMSLTARSSRTRGVRAVRARGLPHAGAVPVRGVSSDDAIAALEQLFLAHVDPATVAAVILEPVQGEGGFIPMPEDFPAGCGRSATATASSGSTTRSRPASAAPARCGRSSTTTRSPTCSCPASRSAAGCRWLRSPGRRDHGRRRPRRPRRHVRRQPGVLRRGQRRPGRDRPASGPRANNSASSSAPRWKRSTTR